MSSVSWSKGLGLGVVLEIVASSASELEGAKGGFSGDAWSEGAVDAFFDVLSAPRRTFSL